MDQVSIILRVLNSLDPEKIKKFEEECHSSAIGRKKLWIGVKKLLILIERARQEEGNEVEKLLGDLSEYIQDLI